MKNSGICQRSNLKCVHDFRRIRLLVERCRSCMTSGDVHGRPRRRCSSPRRSSVWRSDQFSPPAKATGARASANVDAFTERARPYGVCGLKRFVRDLLKEWRDGASHNEGQVDAEGDAIEITTIHSAKGLQRRW